MAPRKSLKTLWIVLLVLVLAGGLGYGGYYAYNRWFAKSDPDELRQPQPRPLR